MIPDRAQPVALHPGDVAVMRGPEPYTVADDPATPPQVIIHPGQRCTTLWGEDLAEAMRLGVRTWGNSPDGSTVMLTGSYQESGEVSRRLLAALPELVVLPARAWDSPVVPLLADEIVKDEPGQEAVLDRLLDLLLIAALLREPGATLGAVARQVGYGSAFALSAAFKRERGISPARYRAERSAADAENVEHELDSLRH